ncbi:hypothetical protein [Sphingomonas hankookensis]|uniref:hypothetical protein n=1 Tax=Sphingomonas hankookensis TaxID=563996 RepID=UPI003D301A3E
MKLHRSTITGRTGRGLAICEGASVVAIVNGDGFPVGIGNGPRSEALANLFTAAPALLTALRDVLAYEDDRPAPGTRGAEIYAAAEAAIAAAEADTFAPTMALALQKRTRGLTAWNHTEQERQDIEQARRNGAGLRIKFRDGSAAFIPTGTAEVRVVA